MAQNETKETKEVKEKSGGNTTLDIVKLIEKNPITRLSKDYQNSLINKIKSKFSESHQQLFVSSFYCYLNHNNKNEFIIDLDNVWKWLGFSRKDPAKRLLEKFFIKDLDYKIVFHQSVENLKGGRPQEQILMTVNTFKKLCLKADTKKADEIHEYYIGLEELLHETINEETQELRDQLVLKDKTIKLNNINRKNEQSELLIGKFYYKRCVYIVEIEENKYIKIGSTKDIAARVASFRRNYNNASICLLDVFECQNFREVEESILQDEIIKKNLYKEDIAGNISKEIVKLTSNFSYTQLLGIVKKHVDSNNLVIYTPEQMIEKHKLELESKKMDFELLTKLFESDKYSNVIEEIIQSRLPELIDKININSLNNKNNIRKVQSNELNESNESNENINNVKPEINYKIITTANIRPHKPMGRKILKIDPNNLNNIIKVYESMNYVIKAVENKGFVKSCIADAIKEDKIYKGYRWVFVDKDKEPKDMIIKPTVKTRRRISDVILELNNDKTKIVNTYPTQVSLAKHLKISQERLRKIIINNIQYNDNYFIEYSICPQELINNYNKPIYSKIHHKSKMIKQINPITKEFTIFKSLTEINARLGFIHTTITDAIKNKHIVGGSLWEFYENNESLNKDDTKDDDDIE